MTALGRDMLIASVLAATDNVVQQATAGDWPAALSASNDRRHLLEQLLQQDPQAGEHGFIRALRDAAAEADLALLKMNAAPMAAVPIPATSTAFANDSRSGNRICTKA